MSENFKDQIACITFTMQKNVMPTLAVIATGDELWIKPLESTPSSVQNSKQIYAIKKGIDKQKPQKQL